MKTAYPTLLLAALLLTPTLSPAQVSRRDLDEIARHRESGQSRRQAPVLQSIDVADTAARRWNTPLIGTWDSLDGEPEEEYADKRRMADTKTIKIRIKDLPADLLVPYNEHIEKQIYNYTVKHAGSMKTILGKYQYFQPSQRKIFLSLGIPEQLTALAIVESGMKNVIKSKAHAVGLWQLIPETARRYGLRCDEVVDERLDITKSTLAAARYLKNAYAQFGSWPLAVSSYNCGPGKVEKAIKKAGSRDFWEVYKYLPAETKEYVPAFIAALYTTTYYKEHGITPIRYQEPRTTVFILTSRTTFNEIKEATNITTTELLSMNPQYVSGVIPGDERKYSLRLPVKYAKAFKESF